MVYAKVEVGIGQDKKKTFEWGKDLVEVSVELNEGANLSNCSFVVYDPDRKILDEFLTYIYEIEGLEPLTVSETSQTSQTNTATNPSFDLGDNVPGAGNYGGTNLSQTQVNNAYKVVQSVLSLGGSSRDAETALITVMQESSLVLQTGGDRDSAGWYQQRTPWGDYRTRTDIAGSTGLFLRGGQAAGTPGLFQWQPRTQNPTGYNRGQAAQGVQRSAFPDKYNNWIPMAEALMAAFGNPTANAEPEEQTAQNQVPPTETVNQPQREQTLAGSQITIYLGMEDKPSVAYSFIHTGVSYSLFDQSLLTFDGKAAAFVLNQTKQNNAFINLTFRELVDKITRNYGLTVRLTEGFEGPKYVYIQQQAETDWELLVRECDRLGLVIKNVGTNEIEIIDRTSELATSEVPTWRLELNKNVTNFSVTHSAESTQGARSSEPDQFTSTGVRKFDLNPDTGEIVEIEAKPTEGEITQQSTAVAGSNLASIKPLTDGSTELSDAVRRENNQRVKGIVLDFETPTNEEVLALTPDNLLLTSGLSDFMDRFWIIESVKHLFSSTGGFVTSGIAYTPLRNKNPQPENTENNSPATSGETSNQSVPGGFIWPTTSRTITSPFGPRSGGNHGGIDIGSATGDAIFASKDGTVSFTHNGCPTNGRGRGDRCGGSGFSSYGNAVYIEHGNGEATLYAHLKKDSLLVVNGQQVRQGQKIGEGGNSGSSTAPHLHFEIRKNGSKVNPLQYLVS